MDPVTATIIASSLSSMFGGLSKSSSEKKSLAEQKRQFDQDYALRKRQDARTQGAYDMGIQSTRSTTPVRQSIINALMSRFGLSGGVSAPAPLPVSAPSPGGPRVGQPRVPTTELGPYGESIPQRRPTSGSAYWDNILSKAL